ncbi:MAG TPA: hypothetical protein VFA08_01370 [Actinomycetota bacterium]|nr:hypothetical protein [Actinomycetota bacterium]
MPSADASPIETLLSRLIDLTRHQQLEWETVANDSFTISAKSATILLTRDLAGTALKVFNPDGLEVATLTSQGVLNSRPELDALFDSVKASVLHVSDVITDVLNELDQLSERERRASG